MKRLDDMKLGQTRRLMLMTATDGNVVLVRKYAS